MCHAERGVLAGPAARAEGGDPGDRGGDRRACPRDLPAGRAVARHAAGQRHRHGAGGAAARSSTGTARPPRAEGAALSDRSKFPFGVPGLCPIIPERSRAGRARRARCEWVFQAVDGTRDQPPGKSAENWSRKDGIRAGAVTGPWRSSPRAEAPRAAAGGGQRSCGAGRHLRPRRRSRYTPTAPRPGRSRAAFPGWWAGSPSGAWRPSCSWPPPSCCGPRRRRRRRKRSTRRGSRRSRRPWPRLPESRAGGRGAGPAAGRTRDHAGTAGRDRRALETAGYPGVQVEALPFRIATTRIGYYREADRPAAEALAREIAPALAEAGDGIGVRDYSQLLADPEPGRLDLWIEG